MDKVRIVRHPQRICLRDILENVYDNFTEIGGQEEHSIDPSMLIARATITRRRGKKTYNQLIMVIGQEKGHGEEFRNGGSVKPWGNSKALQYMKVAETEGIPIHTYVFTPGSFPIEDTPGAAQQIAKNLYEMAGLTVPMVAVFSEGGSGGAEAISLADRRLMLSHGYYSVISPEGAAAIEGRLKPGQRATPELIERCATQLHITAEDNLQFGYIDRVIQEPSLGARPYHYDFFRTLRQEIIRATDETVLSVRSGMFRGALLRRMSRDDINLDEMYIRWHLSQGARERLVLRRQKKFLRLSRGAYIDRRPFLNKMRNSMRESWGNVSARIKYALITKHQRGFAYLMDEMTSEMHAAEAPPDRALPPHPARSAPLRSKNPETVRNLTTLSELTGTRKRAESRARANGLYISPRAKEDRAITCPNAGTHGCLDLWYRICTANSRASARGAATTSRWNTSGSSKTCSTRIPSANSTAKWKPATPCSLKVSTPASPKRGNVPSSRAAASPSKPSWTAPMIVALFAGTFRGGSVGSAEGTKFVEAAELAMKKRYPLLAYVHGTAGIRIQEGTHGVIQMPRCTVAVRRYINAGGLYTVCTTPIPTPGRWRASSAARPTSTPCAPRTSGSPDAASSRKPRA